MRYERQKMIRKELERIPRGLKGSPQNQVRQIVTSQYQHGKSFDESVEIAVAFCPPELPGIYPENLAASGSILNEVRVQRSNKWLTTDDMHT